MEVRRIRGADGQPSWTVVDESGLPIRVVDDYLAYLANIERSPNSQRAYAHDLKTFFTFLAARNLDLKDVTAEDMARFVSYLRRPHADVPIASEQIAVRAATTVNRILAGVGGFYQFLSDRDGLPVAQRLVRQSRVVRRADVSLLGGMARSANPSETIGPRLKTSTRHLQVLTIPQARTIVQACVSRRDQFFFTLLLTTGMRRGQALGLRHSDIDTRQRSLEIRPRNNNENGARAKSRSPRAIPLSRDTCRLYLDYMHEEYGHLDSDYVFVSLEGKTTGHALSEAAIDKLVVRLRTRTGITGWSCHTFRHTFATLHQRAGMRIEIISHLLTHGSIKTTADTYSHLDVEDLRQQLVEHGCWELAQ